ncbi:TonB-dependent receptor [Tenacibaculum sp. C7A-26P2]|uniref:TonB-dependent receptor n=1 Tax=Tenacibaculum sp. C7A-26P2 TaxID=3447504 RepID=UPI003F85A206
MIVFFILFIQQIFSQNIKGKVISADSIPIEGAYILNKNSNHHTHSNIKGNFVLSNVKIGDTLIFSHINYINKQKIVDNLKSIFISMRDDIMSLKEVTIGKKINALNIITTIDSQTIPVNSSQQILQRVPGLFIGQHAGGGKAEQIFLRGFDIDHGTDINITVDGLPANMVSHAHGQGYADLHFVIPETVERIDFGKGAYYGNKGNFNTAGYVNFQTKSRLKDNLIKLEAGQFNTQRFLTMLNVLNSSKKSAYIASEYMSTDGYFKSPQNFNRLNLFGKYTVELTDTDKVGITASHFMSNWNASGQIPVRAVDNDLITRFGAIDDTEGGKTSRTNVLFTYDKVISDNTSIKNSIFYNTYDFELFSNFTFFLEDPINGDQIKQKEKRNIFGISSDYKKNFTNLDGDISIGISVRNDQSFGNELSKTLNRKTVLNSIQFGDINEINYSTYVSTTFNFNKVNINPSLRFDYFNFQYKDALQTNYQTFSETANIVSPKLNVFYNYNQDLQLYLKTGKGFHSNDTRVVVLKKGRDILPASYGFDLGFLWKPTSRLVVNTAYWYLFLEQEFVYVGDAGIVEPSGKTNRQGIDFSFRYELINQLFFNVDTNYAYSRALEKIKGENFIPLAPDFTLTGGLNYKIKSGFNGGLQVRHIGDRPANEDNSIIAKGYTITDFNLGYKFKNLTFGLQIQNMFDVVWNETQFATESRLQNEIVSKEEIHFTPGTPFSLRGSFTIAF